MSFNELLACLGSYARPADAEPWVSDAPRSARMPQPTAEYRRALDDLLTAIGVLTEGQASSATAHYFLQSLQCAILDGSLTGTIWQGGVNDQSQGLGARLLNTLESYRAECVTDPTPLREIEAVIAIIKARRSDQDVYLMQFDPVADQFQPIGGKREAEDSDQEAALARELREELFLPDILLGRDFQLHPVLVHVRSYRVSPSVNLLTRYDHSFYHVSHIAFAPQTDAMTQWLAIEELEAGQSRDGRAISSLTRTLSREALDALPYSLPAPLAE